MDHVKQKIQSKSCLIAESQFRFMSELFRSLRLWSKRCSAYWKQHRFPQQHEKTQKRGTCCSYGGFLREVHSTRCYMATILKRDTFLLKMSRLLTISQFIDGQWIRGTSKTRHQCFISFLSCRKHQSIKILGWIKLSTTTPGRLACTDLWS